MGCIYTLSCPETKEIRYVGQTIHNPKKRLYHHIYMARSGEVNHRSNWIRSLLDKEKRPVLEIVEEVQNNELNIREEYWISFFRKNGSNLTNYGIGGGSHRKYKEPTEEDMKAVASLLFFPYQGR